MSSCANGCLRVVRQDSNGEGDKKENASTTQPLSLSLSLSLALSLSVATASTEPISFEAINDCHVDSANASPTQAVTSTEPTGHCWICCDEISAPGTPTNPGLPWCVPTTVRPLDVDFRALHVCASLDSTINGVARQREITLDHPYGDKQFPHACCPPGPSANAISHEDGDDFAPPRLIIAYRAPGGHAPAAQTVQSISPGESESVRFAALDIHVRPWSSEYLHAQSPHSPHSPTRPNGGPKRRRFDRRSVQSDGRSLWPPPRTRRPTTRSPPGSSAARPPTGASP